MPIKWTAPEILLGEFSALSTQSDVYVKYTLIVIPKYPCCASLTLGAVTAVVFVPQFYFTPRIKSCSNRPSKLD